MFKYKYILLAQIRLLQNLGKTFKTYLLPFRIRFFINIFKIEYGGVRTYVFYPNTINLVKNLVWNLKNKCGFFSKHNLKTFFNRWPFSLTSSLKSIYKRPDIVRWTLKTICYRHVETFAHKPSMNSKIENIFFRSKLAIDNLGENPKNIYGSHEKKRRKS